MFKLNYDVKTFSFKIYEDKFTDDSVLRMEIIIKGENLSVDKFEKAIENIKRAVEDENNKFNTCKILLKLLRAEDLELYKQKINVSPIELFPKFEYVKDLDEKRKEYKGTKYISWDIFKQFSDNLAHATGGNIK